MDDRLEQFLNTHMHKAGRLVPARLQTALALLEKLRDKPTLSLDDHLASKGSSGLESHETLGRRAHKRFELAPINKNHGCRSSSLQDWGQELLDSLEDSGFIDAAPEARTQLIETAQRFFAERLFAILEQDPLRVSLSGKTIEAVIREVLKQAGLKNKAGDVAEYLVAAKLKLRFNIDIPIHAANKPDRKSMSDPDARLGDFHLQDAVIEVAVGPPDEKHIEQIAEALEGSNAEVWLLTRADRVAAWQTELNTSHDIETGRVVVSSVEAFIGQNISELGEFSTQQNASQLKALLKLYNTEWVEQVGTPGIRIQVR